MEIVKMKLSELNPAEYNPRKALKPGDPAYEKLKASILSLGNVEPIVWNRSTGNVIGGHQRLRVLLDLGVAESEVSVVDLSEVDEKRLNIALNKITGEWDDEKLTSLLADLTAGGTDVYPAGFDEQELASMFADLTKAAAHDDGFDLTAALERASFVKRGDIWTIGRHRLVCGDATSAEDVAALMDGKKANLILTDPPYGVSFKSSDGLTIQMPVASFTPEALTNLTNLLTAKGQLIRKALGVTDLPVETGPDVVSFPWFSGEATGEEVKAYTHLVTALCDMARNQKCITAREKGADNEKYAFRCFLLRLGFIGAEYKEERKILLRNLAGNGAFKSGRRGTETIQPEPPTPLPRWRLKVTQR